MNRGRRVELVELDPLAIGGAQHRDGRADILVEPNQFADLRPFDGRFAFEREAECEEERLYGFRGLRRRGGCYRGG